MGDSVVVEHLIIKAKYLIAKARVLAKAEVFEAKAGVQSHRDT